MSQHLRVKTDSCRQKMNNLTSVIAKLSLFLSYLILIIILAYFVNGDVFASGAVIPSNRPTQKSTSVKEISVAKQVTINSVVKDEEISKRLKSILQATTWYEEPSVEVKNGVAFLRGKTTMTEYKEWAEKLAENTQGVVVVINQIDLVNSGDWYLQQISIGLQKQWRGMIRGLPFFVFSVLVFLSIWFVAHFIAKYIRKSLKSNAVHPLLAEVISRGIILLCFVFGLYFVLQILGLTTIALTIIGGTGILGIVLGIAFRDITENLLASIFLSIQNPFHNDDLIEVAGVTGYVQGLTIRATILMTQDGHQIQIPNATVYKSNICNFTSNPNRREDFIISIDYDNTISRAQEVALKVLELHPAVLKDPEPWVLVEDLALGVVNLRVYFWLNSTQYHWRKVKSSLIRLVKRAFQDKGISLPVNKMEFSVSKEIPVRLLTRKQKESKFEGKESKRIATHAEGGLSSEADKIQEQVLQSRVVEKEKNLLEKPKE